MRKIAALFVALAIASPAYATWIAPLKASVCTRDFNAWGQSSHCQCPHATRYESRIGACVQGAPVDIAVVGYIVPFRDLDSGEVSYVLAESDSENYFEVVLPLDLRVKFEEKDFSGQKFRVTGEVIENFDGSTIEQPKILLDRLEVSVDRR